MFSFFSVNSSLPALPPPPSNASLDERRICGSSVYPTFALAAFQTLVLLPLSVIVVYVGHRCRLRRKTLSHLDVFTQHMAFLELLSLFAIFSLSYGIYTNFEQFLKVGLTFLFVTASGQIWFQCVVCVERYVAVVHPVTYLRRKAQSGVRIRNVTLFYIWLSALAWTFSTYYTLPSLPRIPFFIQTAASLCMVSFCCISVLCVLRRPGPGEAVNAQVRADRTKQRAVQTLAAMTCVLFMFFLGLIVCSSLEIAFQRKADTCTVVVSALWFSLPSRLALPLMFLLRTAKLGLN